MAVREPKPDEQLLSWCALLQTADADALAVLASREPAAVARFLDSTACEPGADSAPRLRTLWRRHALEALRSSLPQEEGQRHIAALHFFCTRLESEADQPARGATMDACVFHLTALHDLSIEAMEWNSIVPHLQLARKPLATSQAHSRWLEFFEAYSYLRTEHFVQGLARLEALRAAANLEPALRLRTLHACSLPYADNGHYQEAIQLCEQAIPLAQAIGDRCREGYLLLSIGIVHNDLEDHQRAISYCERALALFRAAGEPRREAHALYEIGNNLARLGEWDRARTMLDASEQLYTQLQLARRLVMTTFAQGMLFLMLGDDERCEAALERTLSITRTEGYGIPTAARDAHAWLGILHQTQGQYERACACFSEALAIAERYDQRHYQTFYNYRLAGTLRLSGRIAEARASYLLAVAGVEELRAATEIEALKLSLLGTAQYIYESLVRFELEHGTAEAALAIVERSRARALLDLMVRQLPSVPEHVAQPTVALAEIQAHLAEDDLLLEYFTTGMLPLEHHALHRLAAGNQRLLAQLVPEPGLLIFAVTKHSLTVHRLSVDPNALRPSSHANDPVLQTIRSASRMRWLSEQLIRPVEPLLAACRRLYIVPHGPLHFIPFAALFTTDHNYLLRAGGPALAIAPSATVLIRNCLALQPRRAAGGLAIGYNDLSGQPLEHAEAEARWVAQLMGGEVWAGPEPKSERLMARGPQLGWLHIAGHAAYDEQMALTSSLRLGQGDALEAGQIMAQLRLSADLVTLSSCRSGVSRVVPGDELLGLQRAFLYAGAPTVVCTQARTHDTVAFLIMDQFYSALRAGAAPAEALRDAQVAVRELSRAEAVARLAQIGISLAGDDTGDAERPFAAPECWATFVLIGRP